MDAPLAPTAESSHGRRARGRSRLSIEGGLFILLALMIGLASINTGENLLYFVLASMLSLLIISGILARINLARLRVQRHYPDEIYAGQHVKGHLEVINGKRLHRAYSIGLTDHLMRMDGSRRNKTGSAMRGFALTVRPRQSANAEIELQIDRRGIYEWREITISSRYPFGFIEKQSTVRLPGRLVVFPKLLPALTVKPVAPLPMGEQESDRIGLGVSIYGVRPYRAGDPARFIHWKNSAKGRGLMIKEFEHEESVRYRIMLDLRCPGDLGESARENFETAISLAATLARIMLRRGAILGMWTPAGNIALSQGTAHLKRILRSLAQVEPMQQDAKPIRPDGNTANLTEVWITYLDSTPPADIPVAANSHIINVRNLKLTA